MPDSYESPADHRPWQARRPDWAVFSQPQGHPAHSGQPAAPPADAQARPSHWAGLGLGQDPTQPPQPTGAAGLGPVGWPAHGSPPGHFPGNSDPFAPSTPDWAAQDPYPNHSDGHAARGGSLERRPPDWLVYDPGPRHPALPGP